MIAQLLAVLAALTLALPALGAEGAPAPAPKLDASFLPQQPELLTYRTTAGGKPGFFTVALTRSGKELEVLVNMIEPGFSKTVWGTLGEDLRPLRSQAIIAIGDQVRVDSRMRYEAGKIAVNTLLGPWGRSTDAEVAAPGPVVDPVEQPVLPRLLPLKAGAAWSLDALDPQKNVLAKLELKVTGEEQVAGVDCFRVEQDGFEGKAIYWIEKGPRRRPIRIEQPASGRVSELVGPPGK